MAKMYPATLPVSVQNDNRRSAERQVFNELQHQLGNDWTVFYSVAWVAPRKKDGALHDGETDFLLIHPQKGILLVEVKGGVIAYDGDTGQWTSTDKNDITHKIDDPFAQAMKGKYALRDKIRSLKGWENEWLHFGHAVIFPDCVCSTNALPPNAKKELLLDASAMNNLAIHLREAYAVWDGTEEELTKRSDLKEVLTRLLAPSFEMANPLSVQAGQVAADMLRLTQEQYYLLDILSRNRRVAIAGSAGSGKTFIAVEKAKRLCAQGFRVLLACYSTPLARHLRAICPEITGDNGFVGTFHEWCKYVANEANVPLPMSNGKSDWDAYPDALSAALSLRPDLRVNALVLDEGQDISDEWWIVLLESLIDQRDGVLYVFYDNNQKLHPGVPIPENLNFVTVDLSENLRNTHRIHEIASNYYESNVVVQAQGHFGRTVEKITYLDSADLAKRLQRTLTQLLITERMPEDSIVVLTPRFEYGSDVPYYLKSAFPNRRITHEYIDRFKGLEQTVVVVAELDERFAALPEATQTALCYVAFSRPTTHLVIMGTADVLNNL